MGDTNKLTGKMGIDTGDFKAQISAINREIRVLESGFRAGAAGLGDWSSSATGLESRIKTLNSQIDLQKTKVANCAAEYKRMVEAHGEGSRAAQDAEIRLNRETETLNKMSSELEGTQTALSEMGEESKSTGDKVEDLGEKSKAGGSKLELLKGAAERVGQAMQAAVGLVVGLAAAVAALATGVATMVLKFAGAADELVELSDKTNISTTRLQEFQWIAKMTGTDLGTITAAHARLIRSMDAGKDITSDQAKAFELLGVSTVDADGNLRDAQAVFGDVLDGLKKIPNETERDAVAMTLFGKSAQELNPLIKEGSEGLDEMAKKAHAMGAVLDEETVAAGGKFQDTLDGIKMGLTGVVMNLVSSFLPGFQGMGDKAGGYIEQLVTILKGGGEEVGDTMGNGMAAKMSLGDLFQQIIGDITRKIPGLMQTGLNMLQSIIQGILTAVPMILPAAVKVIQSLVGFLATALPSLIETGMTILVTLVTAILEQLPLIIQAALQIIVTLANSIMEAIPTLIPVIVEVLLAIVNILVENLPLILEAAVGILVALATGIADALPKLIPAVVSAIITIVEVLIENIPMLIDAALKLILGLAEGLVAAIPVLIPRIPEIVTAIFNALIEALPMIGEAALQLLITLAGGIVENLPMIGESAGQLIQALVDGVIALGSKIWEVGKNLVEGIWKGIQDNYEMFKKKVEGFFNGIVDGINNILGIHSPSKIGIEIGSNFGGSIADSMLGALRTAQRDLASTMGGFDQMAMAGAGAGGGGGISQDQYFNIWGPMQFGENQTPGSIGDVILRDRRF